MRNIFNYENGFMSTINAIADSLILGILWVICSLPVFTIGASSAAFYYAYNKCVRQKTDYILRTFFAGFRSNFKQATQIWLILLGLIVMMLLDFYLLGSMKDVLSFAPVILAAIIALLLICLMWGLYLFAYLARFENPNKAVMKNSAVIMLLNMPWSIMLLLLFAVAVACFLFVPLVSLFTPTLYIFLANKILERIFRKYMTAEDLEKEASYTHLDSP